jgi:hypothetical protein
MPAQAGIHFRLFDSRKTEIKVDSRLRGNDVDGGDIGSGE